MRRGLMGWNELELPVATLEARLSRLRTEMDAAGLDALVVYTNNVRPGAVSFLTGFTPYWSDALLLVQQTGTPVFATALSKRVSEWIRTTDPLSEIVNTPRPGTKIGETLAADPLIRRVGVLEFDTLPAGLADDMAAAAPAVEWADASALFAGLRRAPDEPERRLLARADALARSALGEAERGTTRDAGTLAGLIEKHARLNGAEEAYIAVAPDLAADTRLNRLSQPVALAQRFAVRASVAYNGCWVRLTRTFPGDGAAGAADAWFEDAVRAIEPGRPLGAQLADKVKALPGAALQSFLAEGCTGSYPLSVVASSRMPGRDAPTQGQFLVLSVALTVDGAPWLGAAPLIVGQDAL
jgi:hypothetical protein